MRVLLLPCSRFAGGLREVQSCAQVGEGERGRGIRRLEEGSRRRRTSTVSAQRSQLDRAKSAGAACAVLRGRSTWPRGCFCRFARFGYRAVACSLWVLHGARERGREREQLAQEGAARAAVARALAPPERCPRKPAAATRVHPLKVRNPHRRTPWVAQTGHPTMKSSGREGVRRRATHDDLPEPSARGGCGVGASPWKPAHTAAQPDGLVRSKAQSARPPSPLSVCPGPSSSSSARASPSRRLLAWEGARRSQYLDHGRRALAVLSAIATHTEALLEGSRRRHGGHSDPLLLRALNLDPLDRTVVPPLLADPTSCLLLVVELLEGTAASRPRPAAARSFELRSRRIGAGSTSTASRCETKGLILEH